MKTYDAQTIRLMKLCEIIYKGETGPARDIANLLGCSERTFSSNLKLLRGLLEKSDVHVLYDYAYKSYVFSRKGKFNLGTGWVDSE